MRYTAVVVVALPLLRLVFLLPSPFSLRTGRVVTTSTLHRTGQDRMEIGLEGHRMPQDTGWTRALYVKSQDKLTKNIWSDSTLIARFPVNYSKKISARFARRLI